MQNSGLGNTINPMTSLTLLYHIPLLLIITKRGYEGDAPEHSIMVKVMFPFLEAMDIHYTVIRGKDEKELQLLKECCKDVHASGNTRAIILEKDAVEPYELKIGPVKSKDSSYPSERYFQRVSSNLYPRYSVIKRMVKLLNDDIKIISTTGMISRELFKVADSPRNFYLMGAMGSAAGVGLGYALNQKSKRTVIMDGDGAVLMRMGTLATIGRFAPPNLIHIVFDNECYASTGGQESSTITTDLAKVALACGYKKAFVISEPKDLEDQVKAAHQEEGPSLIVVKVLPRNLASIGRVSWTPEEIKNRFAGS